MKECRPYLSNAPAVLGVKFSYVESNGALRGMGMIGTLIDAQIAELLAPERPARQHALHGFFDNALGEAALENRFGRPLLNAADITRVMMIDFLVALATG